MINPFTLGREAKIASNITKDFQTMNQSNWRTNVHGILIGVLMLASIFTPKQYHDDFNYVIQALMCTGLISAADKQNLR